MVGDLEPMKIRPMVYSLGIIKPEILAHGCYNKIEYWVINYGNHPCAYLGFPEGHKFYNKHYDDLEIDCHGGLTFSGIKGFSNKWLIGWDYAHYLDYTFMMPEGHQWTTEEIIKEIMGVIDENELEVK